MFNSERKARKKESGIIPTASCCLTHYPSARACQNPDIEWVDDSHIRQGPAGNYPSQFEQTLNLILIHDARIGGSSPTRQRRMLFERHVLATPASPTAESFEGDPSLKWVQNHKNDGSHFSQLKGSQVYSPLLHRDVRSGKAQPHRPQSDIFRNKSALKSLEIVKKLAKNYECLLNYAARDVFSHFWQPHSFTCTCAPWWWSKSIVKKKCKSATSQMWWKPLTWGMSCFYLHSTCLTLCIDLTAIRCKHCWKELCELEATWGNLERDKVNTVDLQIPMKFHGSFCSYNCVVTPGLASRFHSWWDVDGAARKCTIWRPCAKSRQSAMSSKSPLGLLSDSSTVLPLETMRRNQVKCAKSHISESFRYL